MNKYTKLTALAFAASLAFAATSAHATNGVLEINQACAAVGCFAGDDPGFPVEIKNTGSYRLTSNLRANTDTIVISIHSAGANSTVDLNGFAVQGVCGNSTCATAGSASVINVVANHVSIQNGSVSGGKGDGVSVTGLNNSLEKLRVHNNERNGIFWGFAVGGVVNNSIIDGNKNVGISANNSATSMFLTVRNSQISNNKGATGQLGGICEANVYMNNDADLANQEQCALRLSRTSDCIKGNSTAPCGS